MAEDAGPTEVELRAFVGPSADKYWRRWGWYIERNARVPRGLWPPFFFNFIWFLYRRMYRELWVPIVIVGLVGAAQGVFEGMVEMRIGAPYSVPRIVDTGINAGLGLATSYVGSYLYLRKARKAVLKARATQLDAESQLAILREAGGTSRVAAGIGVAIALALAILNLASMEASG